MCEKHKAYFKNKLLEWKKDLVKSNNEALYNSSLDDNSTSADIVDQASSYTEKNVEIQIGPESLYRAATLREKKGDWQKAFKHLRLIAEAYTEYDFEKITNYYGIGSPVLAGEGIADLLNVKVGTQERKSLTLMAAITGLFDDFFDRSYESSGRIKGLMSLSPKISIPFLAGKCRRFAPALD